MTTTEKTQSIPKYIGLFLLVIGMSFAFHAIASLVLQWDWGLDIPFHYLIPVHADGALIGLFVAYLGAAIFATSTQKTKKSRSGMAGVFLVGFIAALVTFKFGPFHFF